MENINIIKDTIENNKWWRYFNLIGLTVKLINPITREYNPSFHGDPYFIEIVNYVCTLSPSGKMDYENINLYSDWVLFKNNFTPVNRNYSIHLSLVDFEHFKTINI